jgi:tetratricopeptide (TPR) repeat protein
MIRVWTTNPPVAPAGGEEAGCSAGPFEAGRLADAAGEAFAAGRWGEALQAYDEAHAMYPLPELRCRQAACLEQLGLCELAAQRYETYLSEAPGAPDADAVQAQATALHVQARAAAQGAQERAQSAGARGQWREAAWACAQAYEQLPSPRFLLEQARMLERAGDRPSAVRCLQQLLDAHPGEPDVDAAQVRARIDALEDASRAARLKPGP